ncbi:hypothetical protein [Streptomyces hokutonensis]|uniref:hypothetical protein n=1 Tax=Streptomyces hokutonensis TaxID=1306990 RepID=UPI0036CC8456
MTDLTEHDHFLDFPGADELVAAGAVAPPADDKIMAVREMLALIADRENEQALAALAHDNVTPLGAARRDGPAAALAPPGEPEPVARRRRLSRRGRVLVTVGAVAAIAAGVTVYPVLDLGGKPPSAASAASEFLNEMANVSIVHPVTGGKYWMVEYYTKEGRHSVLQTVYSDRAGGTWLLAQNGKVKWLGRNNNDWIVNGRHVSWDELDRLPTDPAKLRTHFSKDAQDWSEEAIGLLADSPASPALRSALFRMIAKSPVVTTTPGVKDSRGRPGTEVVVRRTMRLEKLPGTTQPGVFTGSYRCVIDPKTSRVLECGAAGPDPDVRTTYFQSGLTNRIG